jgi:acetolactate synthase regulatory subunit
MMRPASDRMMRTLDEQVAKIITTREIKTHTRVIRLLNGIEDQLSQVNISADDRPAVLIEQLTIHLHFTVCHIAQHIPMDT